MAEREVARFHRLAGEGEIGRLYDEAADELKRTTAEREFRDLLHVIDERLGEVQRADRQGWQVNYTPAGTVVTLTYDTRFERGRGTEQFIYRVTDGEPQLLGYHINSNAVMARPSRSNGEAQPNTLSDEDEQPTE